LDCLLKLIPPIDATYKTALTLSLATYNCLLMRLFYFLDKLAGKCFGKKLSRPRRFTLGGAAVRFYSFYGTTDNTKKFLQ
jgi:hypothetical protein